MHAKRPLLTGLVIAALGAACSRTPPLSSTEAAPPQVAAGAAAGAEASTTRAQPFYAAEQPLLTRTATVLASPPALMQPLTPPASAERYAPIDDKGLVRAAEQPVSTFSIDVDTGAYAVVRRHLQHGRLPPTDAVRIEELINYFRYGDRPGADAEHPLAIETELAQAPWHQDRQLLRITLNSFAPAMATLPPANLVFLIDVSGSMAQADKLPLLKAALRVLTRQLRPQDRVSLVTYAGHSAVVLEPTTGDEQQAILAAIDRLGAGGSTAGEAGLRMAYQLAAEHRIEDGVNRVMIATDGDFNVGISDVSKLVELIETERDRGTALSTLGFGQGNYNDHLMEQLADHGDGNYAYIDSLAEADKVLREELSATLLTVATDTKLQVEFNPAAVAEYRLLGYHNRRLREQDFSDDSVDAGDVGAGHSVTALYEITPAGSAAARLAPRRYDDTPPPADAHPDELAWVKLRYKRDAGSPSTLLEWPVARSPRQAPTADLQFAAAVAAWGEWLRDAPLDGFDAGDSAALARAALGEDPRGLRRDFVRLATLSQPLR